MLPLPILVGAALIDSINPCAFGVLLFLLAYLAKKVKHPQAMLLHGLTYISAVFLTYLVAGLALLPVLSSFHQTSLTLYAIIGALVIIFGLLEIKDFFWYGQGPSLALLPGAASRLKTYVGLISKSLPSSFILGVFVALVELPCTGAVYLAVLSMISLSGLSIGNTTLLLLYNVIFVLPLIVILWLFTQGTSVKKIEDWRKRHRAQMRLLIGLLLVFLGGWMIQQALF